MSNSKSTKQILSAPSSWLLKGTLFIGWLLGNFFTDQIPIKLLLQNVTKIQPKSFWKNFMFYICTLQFAITISLFIDTSFFATQSFKTGQETLSEFIMSTGLCLGIYCTAILRKILFVTAQSKLMLILQGLNQLKIQHPLTSKELKHKLTTLAKISLFGMSCTIGKVVELIRITENSNFKSQIIPTDILHAFLLIFSISSYISCLLSKFLVPLLGEQLAYYYQLEIDMYIKICDGQDQIKHIQMNELMTATSTTTKDILPTNKLNSKRRSISETISVVYGFDESKQRIKILYQCFKAFNGFVGGHILICIFHGIFLIIWNLYCIANVNNPESDDSGNNSLRAGSFSFSMFTYSVGIVDEILTLFLIGHTGELLKNTITTTKEKVKSVLFKFRWNWPITAPFPIIARNEVENRIPLGNFILNWKFKLTAYGFFTINHTIYPFAAGALLTMIIFIFQLRLPEELAKIKSSRATV